MILVRVIVLSLCFSASGVAPAARAASSPAPRQLEPAQPKPGAARDISFEKQIVPLLSKYCYGCHGNGKHKGDFSLEPFKDLDAVMAEPQVWQKVLENLRGETMPPPQKPKPSGAENRLVTDWIEKSVFQCDCDNPDPGRVTIRRLNRAEYNNTIRDLVGVNVRPADNFPADDSGYGFDNIGDVLSVPPLLLEKYLTAAESILDEAIVLEDPARQRLKRFAADALPGSAPGQGEGESGVRLLSREGDIRIDYLFPKSGEYALRARAFGQQAGSEPPRMRFSLGTNVLQTFDVPVVDGQSQVYETKVKVTAGTNRFSAAYINNFVDRKKGQDRNLYIEHLEIEGPLDVPPDPLPASHTRIFYRGPGATNNADAAAIIERFAQRAYRRPARAEETARLTEFAKLARRHGESFEHSVKLALGAILISPQFLFRGESHPEPGNPKAAYLLDEFSLASRLSYFLWSSMPDDELYSLALQGRLRKNLDRQVRRMLQDPRSDALVDNFAGQWLQLRNMRIATPDAKTFPQFDEPLRDAMVRETEMFFEQVMRENRSVLDFLDADYTYVNGRLARHYGIPGVTGDAFQRVSLRRTGRSGVLTHASLLTLTSNPTRTSPVKRGKYVLENILGTPPPPPPPDVPELKEVKLVGTLRQRMTQHRENTLCASCHNRMDPIGFGFENFDGIGAWRDKEESFPVDPAGVLVSGESFKGASDLARILAKQKRDEFARCLSQKMLIYALGRGLEFYDKCAVDQVSRDLRRGGYKFSALILAVTESVPFQQRRGENSRKQSAH